MIFETADKANYAWTGGGGGSQLDFTLISLRTHFGFTSTSHRRHLDCHSISFEFILNQQKNTLEKLSLPLFDDAERKFEPWKTMLGWQIVDKTIVNAHHIEWTPNVA